MSRSTLIAALRAQRSAAAETLTKRVERSYTISALIDPGTFANREYKPHRETVGFERGFCATLFQAARNSLILKRRDVRVVEGARLEIALAMIDGVLQISITVAEPTT